MKGEQSTLVQGGVGRLGAVRRGCEVRWRWHSHPSTPPAPVPVGVSRGCPRDPSAQGKSSRKREFCCSCPSPVVLQQEPGAAAIRPRPQSEPGPLAGVGHDP